MISSKFDLHKKGLVEQSYFTGTMPLVTTAVLQRGGPKVFTSTTIFKKCGGKTSSGGQERYILKTRYEK